MINAQYVNLNMTPSGVVPILHCSQYDVGRPLGLVVYNGSEAVDLDSYTCTIEATRTDGTAITAAATTTDNIGVFTTTATMTNVADQYDAQLVLVDSGSRRVASLPFIIRVVEASMDESAESIEEDASLYEQYTSTVQTIIAEIREDLETEISDREDAVTAEAEARESADETLQDNIDAEATARANAVASEASARATADTNLQTQLNSEISARTSADTLLQTQIDELVAPSGSAPSEAEIYDARIGADSTTYDTLGEAIRTQIDNIEDATIATWIQGYRNASDASHSSSIARCTTAIAYSLVAGDIITLTNPSGTYKANIRSTSGVNTGSQTSDYIYIVDDGEDGLFYSNVSNATDDTVTVSPSDVDIVFTVIRNASIPGVRISSMKYVATLDDGTDLDDVYENGWYILSYSGSYLNTPESSDTTGQRLVLVYSTTIPTGTTYRIMTYYNCATGVKASRVYTNEAWENWYSDFCYHGALDSGADLDDLYMPGWYILRHSGSYTNTPEETTTTGQRYVIIYSSGKSSTVQHSMYYYNLATGVSAFRLYTNQAWEEWHMNFSYHSLPSNDLDDFYAPGNYFVAITNTSITNAPEADGSIGRRLIVVYANHHPTDETFRHMLYWNYNTQVFGHRLWSTTGGWGGWKTYRYPVDGIYTESFTRSASASQGENSGTKLRVMTYNVARYNNNTSTYITDEKIVTFRKMLGRINADIVCTQEDMPYIDSSTTQDSRQYLWYPQYPYAYGYDVVRNEIHSKVAMSNSGVVYLPVYPNVYRCIKYATVTIDSNTVLVCTLHASWNDSGEGGTSATSIANRLEQYTAVFDWVEGRRTLSNATSGGTQVSVPSHTHCIICMDGNTATDTDKSNLESLASTNSFHLANGGVLGWFYTNFNVYTTTEMYSLDNIMVSDNIIINNVDTPMSEFSALYSDHIPVYADLTLL